VLILPVQFTDEKVSTESQVYLDFIGESATLAQLLFCIIITKNNVNVECVTYLGENNLYLQCVGLSQRSMVEHDLLSI